MSKYDRFVHFGTITIGVMIVTLCGLCTLSVTSSGESKAIAPVAWGIGGASMMGGLWLVVKGIVDLWLERRK